MNSSYVQPWTGRYRTEHAYHHVPSSMPHIVDDKSQHCVPFLLSLLSAHQARHRPHDPPPFFIGLNGVQGAGKTVLVSTLQETLRSPPYSLPLVTLSLDDIYLTHADQHALAQSHPSNPLLQHRGQPSTPRPGPGRAGVCLAA